MEVIEKSTSAEDRYRGLLAVNSMASFSDRFDWCRKLLEDADSSVRAIAVKTLGELKLEATVPPIPWRTLEPELATLLDDVDVDVRFEAARTIGRINPQDERSVSVLLSLLADLETQPLMLASLVKAISDRPEIDIEKIVAPYGEILSHEQPEVRESVSAAIAGWGKKAESLVINLLKALDDDEPLVRENAARALSHCSNSLESVLNALKRASDDEDKIVATTAKESIDLLMKER